MEPTRCTRKAIHVQSAYHHRTTHPFHFQPCCSSSGSRQGHHTRRPQARGGGACCQAGGSIGSSASCRPRRRRASLSAANTVHFQYLSRSRSRSRSPPDPDQSLPEHHNHDPTIKVHSHVIGASVFNLPVQGNGNQAVDRGCHGDTLYVGHKLAHQPSEHPRCEFQRFAKHERGKSAGGE